MLVSITIGLPLWPNFPRWPEAWIFSPSKAKALPPAGLSASQMTIYTSPYWQARGEGSYRFVGAEFAERKVHAANLDAKPFMIPTPTGVVIRHAIYHDVNNA